jgi:membrane associated rhomboid family serine protease
MVPIRDSLRTRRPAVVNWAIIAACIGVYIWQLQRPDFGISCTFRPHDLLDLGAASGHGLAGLLRAALLSMFMHGGLLHLAGNTLFLWVFGDNVEDSLGPVRYLLFYLTCGLLAILGHSAMSGFGGDPIVGASGAIAGVLGGYWILFRGARVSAIVPLIFIWTVLEMPAVVFLGLWFVFQVLAGLGWLAGAGHSAVAFWAHIVGFLAGALLVGRFVPRRFRGPRVIRVEFH